LPGPEPTAQVCNSPEVRVTMRVVTMPMIVLASSALAACVAQPAPGPQVFALPGPGKSSEQFQADNVRCQQVAANTAGPLTPAQAAAQSGVGTAAVGTALGAATGALVGSAAGAAGAGAAVGAGAGLLAGSAVGAGAAQQSAAALQNAYNLAYAQCMSAAGESVPNLATLPAGYPADTYPAYGYAPPVYGYVYPPPFYYYYGAPIFIGGGWGWGWHRWRH
ncbi:MAG TPA: hypothetical protein VHO91_02420, partial [Rhodopila sp.]|nr:hypothetical protein [Rhodopila sp.]